MSSRTRLGALLAATLLLASPARAVAPPPTAWQSASEPAGAVVALAYEPGAGRLAVADRAAVWVGPAHGRLSPVHRARGVHALVFEGDGTLWIAGDEGLERWRPGSSSEAVELGAGAAAVHRLCRAGERWLAASSDGLHVQGEGGTWTRLDLAMPSGVVTALAAAPRPGGVRIGAVVDGVAHWLFWPTEARAGAAPAREHIGTPGDGPHSAVDVWLAPDAGEAWTLLRDGCLVGARRVCVPLPPGAEAQRIFRVDGRWWLTTPRGVLRADAPDGPWRRAAPPLGSLESYGVAAGGGDFFVGTERGLLVASAADRAPAPAAPAPAPRKAESSAPTGLAPAAAGAVADLPPALLAERRDPPLEAVRHAALAYLDLGGERLRNLRHGPERRGWLPEMTLRLGHDHSRSHNEDYDEAFLSGGLRRLFDHTDDRSSGFDATLSIAWDFGDIVYHPESVDVSREMRELVELRDDVLDEIHHLYFERRRVLLELLELPEGRPFEAARLRLRADELAAGIDAWTGGWFSRHAVRLAP